MVLPFIVLMPSTLVARAAWQALPRLWWRTAILASATIAFLLTNPRSPIFIGLRLPVALIQTEDNLGWAMTTAGIVAVQFYFLNAAIIAALVLLPVNGVYTFVKLRRDRKSNRK